MDRRMLRRLRREALRDAVVVELRDGSTKVFNRTDVAAELFLVRLDASLGRPLRQGDVLDALRNATPEGHRVLEEIANVATGDFDDLATLGTKPPSEPVPDLSE